MDIKRKPAVRPAAGFSLIEMLVAITIGLVLLTGLVTYFVNASNTQRELQRSAQQIESGRYALDVLMEDLRLAGYYGAYSGYSTPSSLPDPCDSSTTALTTALGLPVQGYQASSMTTKPAPSSTCAPSGSWLTAANLKEGSDILVVRYADPSPEAMGTAGVTGQRYLLSNAVSVAVQTGTSTLACDTDVTGSNASGITRKCNVPTSSDACSTLCGTGGSPLGDTRKMIVRIYYVSPCNVPASGSACNGTSDDGGTPIPTLKRLEMTTSTWSVVPIAEGVEYMKLQYGVDSSPTAANSSTGLIGDGVPDTYTDAPALADFANTVSVRVDLLVRNPEKSAGYTTSKTYNLGVSPSAPGSPNITIGPYSDNYRRHVYAAEIRLTNLSGRRENP